MRQALLLAVTGAAVLFAVATLLLLAVYGFADWQAAKARARALAGPWPGALEHRNAAADASYVAALAHRWALACVGPTAAFLILSFILAATGD